MIVLGHSMGGLLAAEAATDLTVRQGNSKQRRIIGVVAFDVPYLGMHPHVVSARTYDAERTYGIRRLNTCRLLAG